MDKLKIKDALVQVALRMIPLIPANEMTQLFEALTKQESDIEKQVGEAVSSLKSTSSLVTQLEQSLKEKTYRLEKLHDEYNKYTELTTITREQAKSISQLLESTIRQNRTREILIPLSMHIGTGIVFLILGVIMAEPIARLWHSLGF
jgi:DNA-binding transcriptional regulator YbjK